MAPRFENWYEVPVIIDNDAMLMARGEHRAARASVDSLLYLKLGSAIGCGIIVDGNVHRGYSGGAGEIGHMPIQSDYSRPCVCGRENCLQSSVGGAAIIKHLLECGHDIHTTVDLVQLVDGSDPDAMGLARAAGTGIGSAVAILADFFNPEAIILGGRLSSIEALARMSARRSMAVRCRWPCETSRSLSRSLPRTPQRWVAPGRSSITFSRPAGSTRISPRGRVACSVNVGDGARHAMNRAAGSRWLHRDDGGSGTGV